MKRDTGVTWRRTGVSDMRGTRVVIVGGTGGIGRALSRQLASHGAEVTVVGRTYRDADTPGIEFVRADLSLMSEAERVAAALPAEHLDLLVMTTGIFAAPKRQDTIEGLERDLAVSYLSRLVLVRSLAGRLGVARSADAPRARIFVYGYPGSGQGAHLEDLNSDQGYSAMKAHMNTVAGNEALVLDAAQRYPGIGVFGLNPGLLKTSIRNNMLDENSLRHRVMETVIGWLTPSVDTYARTILPLLVTPDLDNRSGLMFDKKGNAIHPSPALTPKRVDEVITASESLLARVVTGPRP